MDINQAYESLGELKLMVWVMGTMLQFALVVAASRAWQSWVAYLASKAEAEFSKSNPGKYKDVKQAQWERRRLELMDRCINRILKEVMLSPDDKANLINRAKYFYSDQLLIPSNMKSVQEFPALPDLSVVDGRLIENRKDA